MTCLKFSKCISALICILLMHNIKYALSISEEMLELANMLHKTCQDENGTPEELIVNSRKGDFAEDNTLKCYMKCIMAQMAIIEDDGTIDEDGMLAVMPEEMKDVAERVVRGCGTKRGVDACDTAFQTNKCYYAAAPEHYFMP